MLNEKIKLLEKELSKKIQVPNENLTTPPKNNLMDNDNIERNNEIRPRINEYSKLNIASPEPYSGSRNKSKIDSWIWQLNQYFKFKEIKDENVKTEYSISLLRNNALTWFRSLSVKPHNYEDLICKIKKNFMPVNHNVMGREKISKN